ncbi:hypothetical protein BH23GEM5_BH23GEM5_11650 [soil metagenome]
MNTLWQDLRGGGRAVSRAAAIAMLAALTLAFGVSATRGSCPEDRYAVQEVSRASALNAPGQRHESHVRYMDYRDRSVPLLVW